MKFTINELSYDADVSLRTMFRRVAELKKNGKFKKQSKGKFLEEEEALEIARLLNFTIKKLQMKTKLTALIFVSVLFFSCSKDGQQGPAGPQGTAGTNGISNIHTSLITTVNSDWTYNSASGIWYTDYSNSYITSSVINNGTVQVYKASSSGTAWFAMPFTESGIADKYIIYTGALELQIQNNSSSSNPGGVTFKIVVIPG